MITLQEDLKFRERLTNQIGNELKDILGTEDVAVVDAKHLCIFKRKGDTSSTTTSFYSGKFKSSSAKKEFQNYLIS